MPGRGARAHGAARPCPSVRPERHARTRERLGRAREEAL
ncbi:hypothetical protein STTU_4227 [Streptomyces sp. Tu6071]|nr:hypothetical protein STTU_4227 [Streptomyces sp. Tu6071]